MNRKKKWVFAVVIAAVVLISTFLYTQSQVSPSRQAVGAGSLFDEIEFQATRENLTDTIEIKGKSSYAKETIIYAPFSAEVVEWLVEEGQSVQEGDVLFELNAAKGQQEIALTEARILEQQLDLKLLNLPKNEAESQDIAVLERFASKEQDEQHKRMKQLELDIARNELDDLIDRLSKSSFPSPESGIFLFTQQQLPKAVEQNEPIGKIVDLSELQLITEVSEFEVFRIHEGMEVDVRIDALKNEIIKGTVNKVSKFAKATTGTNTGSAKFEATITLEPHSKLFAGLSLTGKIITDQVENAVVIPTLAVVRENNESFVYVKNATGVEKRTIQIGLETANKTEVIEGLAEGESIVLR